MLKSNLTLLDELLGGKELTEILTANELSILLSSLGENNSELFDFATEVEQELNFSI